MADSLRRRMMMGQGGSRLPAGYIELQYVECDGTQYARLNTQNGYSPIVYNSSFEIYTKYLASSGSPYGYVKLDYSNGRELGVTLSRFETVIYCGRVNANPSTNYEYWIPNVTKTNTSSSSWHTITQTYDGVIFDEGVLEAYVKRGGPDSVMTCPIGNYFGVCCEWDEATLNGNTVRTDSLLVGYMAELRISNSGNVLCDLIPAMDSTLEVGFYDIVNQNFITSESGTAFIAGPVK